MQSSQVLEVIGSRGCGAILRAARRQELRRAPTCMLRAFARNGVRLAVARPALGGASRRSYV